MQLNIYMNVGFIKKKFNRRKLKRFTIMNIIINLTQLIFQNIKINFKQFIQQTYLHWSTVHQY